MNVQEPFVHVGLDRVVHVENLGETDYSHYCKMVMEMLKPVYEQIKEEAAAIQDDYFVIAQKGDRISVERNRFLEEKKLSLPDFKQTYRKLDSVSETLTKSKTELRKLRIDRGHSSGVYDQSENMARITLPQYGKVDNFDGGFRMVYWYDEEDKSQQLRMVERRLDQILAADSIYEKVNELQRFVGSNTNVEKMGMVGLHRQAPQLHYQKGLEQIADLILRK